MGIIITKFRKKKTTYEVLEKLDNEIKSIEEFGRSTEQTQKKIVGRFVLFSVCTYFISAFIFYFYFFPASLSKRIIYIIPLILLPILLFFIKRTLSWYYSRKLCKNEQKLVALKDEKKKLLDHVMDKETYKVAKTILEKFAPEQVKKPIEQTPKPVLGTPLGPSINRGNNQTGLRYRASNVPATPNPALVLKSISTPTATPSVPQKSRLPQLLPATPLSRAILPKDRSVLDKMVDYLVGDGPSNRFALICKQCSGHNGMALKEEFDYLSFRCCYCMTFNAARKQRPLAPKLELENSVARHLSDEKQCSDSDTESSSTDNKDGPVITEVKTDEDEKLFDLDEDKVSESPVDVDDDKKLEDSEKKVENNQD